MRDYKSVMLSLMKGLALSCFLIFVGCGVSITQESAQQAIYEAQIAVETAESASEDIPPSKDLKSARRLLSEAEEALERGRRQRAYTLANKAKESAISAEEEAIKQLEEERAQMPEEFPTPYVVEEKPSAEEQPIETVTPQVVPVSPVQPTVEPRQVPIPSTHYIPVQEGVPMSELQRRVEIAVKALQGAQSAVEAAQLLLLKIQAEIGLSMEEANIQQLKASDAPAEAISMVQSWYAQARKASNAGDYENSNRILEKIKAYIQAISPAQ